MESMARWWTLLLVLLGAAACAGSPPTVTPPAPTADVGGTATIEATADPLTIEILRQDVAVGFERVSFRILDASGIPISAASDVEGVFNRVSQLSAEQQLAQRVASGKAFYFGEDMPGGGSWVVYSDFDASGTWWLDVTATREGWRGQGRGELEVAGRSDMPRVGDKPPDANTPKVGPDTPVAGLTSDPDPLEALYRESLADAVAGGKAAVVLFASPAHCETPACAATLEELKATQRSMGSQAAFIHVESRDPADPGRLSAIARAWALPSEPWMFVFNGRGYVAARVEGEIGQTELQLLLQNILQR